MTHKFIGKVVMHCHILFHEDAGMMMTTEILNQGIMPMMNNIMTIYCKQVDFKQT